MQKIIIKREVNTELSSTGPVWVKGYQFGGIARYPGYEFTQGLKFIQKNTGTKCVLQTDRSWI